MTIHHSRRSRVLAAAFLLAGVLSAGQLSTADADSDGNSDAAPTVSVVPLATRFSGRMTGVTVNPADPNIIVAASESGGLFQSFDDVPVAAASRIARSDFPAAASTAAKPSSSTAVCSD